MFYQTFKELLPVLLKLFMNDNGQMHFQIYSMSKYYTHVKIWARTEPKKENYMSISLISINVKILNKILPHQIQQHIKKIIHHDQIGFISQMQG
jgi:hypothetical protein